MWWVVKQRGREEENRKFREERKVHQQNLTIACLCDESNTWSWEEQLTKEVQAKVLLEHKLRR